MICAGKAYFGRRYTISASHRLHAESLTPEENAAVYGKCNNPHGHGHNYVVEVVVGGGVNDETGMSRLIQPLFVIAGVVVALKLTVMLASKNIFVLKKAAFTPLALKFRVPFVLCFVTISCCVQ